jgi:hypothetical protein
VFLGELGGQQILLPVVGDQLAQVPGGLYPALFFLLLDGGVAAFVDGDARDAGLFAGGREGNIWVVAAGEFAAAPLAEAVAQNPGGGAGGRQREGEAVAIRPGDDRAFRHPISDLDVGQ